MAKKHLRWLGQTISMPEYCLPRQVLYSQPIGAKRSAGGLNQHFKDYTRDLLKRANIPLTQLESLALDRSAWQFTCATAVSQIHQTNQDLRSERCIKRNQWVAGTPPGIWFPLLHLRKSVRLKDRTPRPQEIAPAATWLNPPPFHPHPWSKRHHRTRWTAKRERVCVCVRMCVRARVRAFL